MKPLTTLRIALANVAGRPMRSILLGVIAAVFSFMLFSGAMIAANLESGIASLSARMGADLLVVPQGEGKKIESVILRAQPSAFYLDAGLLDTVKKLPGVAAASGQVFLASLDAQCCTVKVQLIGIDQKTDFVVAPWLRKAAEKPLAGNEVIVGDYIFGAMGSELTFYGEKFKIVGRLAPTGMGFDSSIFMTTEAARKLAAKAMPERAQEIAKSFSSILVRVKPGVDPVSISDQLLDELGLGANVNFVFAANMMSDTAAKLRNVVGILYGATGGFWGISTLIMLIVYFFAFNERMREFATLRALGASSGKVIRIVLTEALMVSVIGSIVGVLLGGLAVTGFSSAIASTIGLPYLTPAAGSIALALLASLAAGAAAVPLAALPTARRIARVDLEYALRDE